MNTILRVCLSASLLALAALACGAPVGTNAVNTAVAGTQQSQALAQATVNSNALTAMPATPTPGPTVDYTTMSEEELTALIDQAVNEAVTATENTTTAVNSTTSDSSVTTDDVTYVYDYYYYAEYYVNYSNELMQQYLDEYADLATQMVAELDQINSQLTEMNATLSSIDESLKQISSTLEQGQEVTQEAIAQLQSAANEAQTKAQALKDKASGMKDVLASDQQGRLDQISKLQPNNIPTDKIAALQQAFDFIDAAKSALSDNKLSRDELMNLAQLGKNAQAGFQKFGGGGGGPFGGVDFSQFSGQFDQITQQFARGQLPQARGGVDQFERSLGKRPGRP